MLRHTRFFVLLVFVLSSLLASCGPASSPKPAPLRKRRLRLLKLLSPRLLRRFRGRHAGQGGAVASGQYRNLFKEMLGKSDADIQAKLDAAWKQMFYGNDDTQRVYYPVGTDMAYILDTGNSDVRSEGMSYGMMIAVQLNKKEEFDRIWKWAKTYMYQKDGSYQGYFAWHCRSSGEQIDNNRLGWRRVVRDGADVCVGAMGDGTGIFNYRAEAQAILDTMLHKQEQNSNNLGANMFDAKTKQVVFVPMIGRNSSFTDPSYHLPAYYELWARWADKDNEFWKQAAQASREFFKRLHTLRRD